ncbi:MAG: hypothetical protein MK080_05465 [Opitutales bacterium]|nr:hypothetical protein [Opitutales bacterium]NRA27567.1 hypothetical protein [Opitutales bacterium]
MEVEGINESGELRIRGNVAVGGGFDRVSISRGAIELDAKAYSGREFELTLNQNEDILRIDPATGRIRSPDNFDLRISLEKNQNIVATVDLPIEITKQYTSGNDTYSQWYGDQNPGGR